MQAINDTQAQDIATTEQQANHEDQQNAQAAIIVEEISEREAVRQLVDSWFIQ